MLSKNLITGKCFCDGSEISEAEYEAELEDIKEKSALVEKLYSGAISVFDIPAEWQEEIQRRAEERAQAAQEEPEISADEALDIILGGET